VGFGTEGASGNAGIDVELLQLLAQSTDHGFFHVTQSSLGLDKFFVNAIAGAVDNDVIIDPIRTIAPGETHTLDVPITCQDYSSTFILTWDSPSENLNLSLETPSGIVISSSNAGLFGNHLSTINRSSYKLIKINYPIVTGVSEEQGGTWKMRISNPSTTTSIKYSSSAISESSIHMTMDIPPPAPNSFYTPGSAIPLNVDLFQNGSEPITTSVVHTRPNVPLINLNDFLASAAVTPVELSTIPMVVSGDSISINERVMTFLQKKYGGDLPLLRSDLTPIETQVDAKGNLRQTFDSTEIEGYYQFTATAEGIANCDPFTRQTVKSVYIGSRLSDDKTYVEVIPVNEDSAVVVTVTPITTSGSFVGVGISSDIMIESDGSLKPSSRVTDNLNGSYSRTFTITNERKGIITISYKGQVIRTLLLDLSIPTVNSVSPSGGATTDHQTVTISTDNTISYFEGITGIILSSTDTNIQTHNVSVMPESGKITAEIPAIVPPGLYSISIEKEGYIGAILTDVHYKVSATETILPKEVVALQDNIDQLLKSSNKTESTILLGKILQNMRKLPIGSSLTSEIKEETIDTVMNMMFLQSATPSAEHINVLQNALELSKIDARNVGR
jgi:hypothetical protein